MRPISNPTILPAVRVKEEPFVIVGSTAAHLRASLARLGPVRGGRRFGACTDWEIAWRITPLGEGGLYVAGRAVVEVAVTMVLPSWTPPRTAPADLVLRWGRYLGALRRHEEGHARIAGEAGREITARIATLAPFASPDALRRAAAAAADGSVERAIARERAYDAETEHGASQGVALPE